MQIYVFFMTLPILYKLLNIFKYMVLWNYLDIKKKDRYPCNAGKQSSSYYNINIIIPFYQ